MKKHHQDTLSNLLTLGEAAASTLLGAAQEFGATHKGTHNILGPKTSEVSREEFDAAFAMVKKTRQVQDDLDKRLKQIEAKLNLSSAVLPPDEKQILQES